MIDLTGRAIKQVRNASTNLEKAAGGRHYDPSTAEAKAARLLTVFANSMEYHGLANRGQVEAAVADYFDAISASISCSLLGLEGDES